jgi:predicted RNA binding protein YcfA (HicA-like mRNA interferase family)
MGKCVTFAALERALLRMGFAVTTSPGSHKVFRHPDNDAVLVIPARPGRARVDSAHLIAVRRTLGEKGLAVGEAFDQVLEAV